MCKYHLQYQKKEILRDDFNENTHKSYTLLREIKEDLNKERAIPCSWNGRLNVNINVLIFKLNNIHIHTFLFISININRHPSE